MRRYALYRVPVLVLCVLSVLIVLCGFTREVPPQSDSAHNSDFVLGLTRVVCLRCVSSSLDIRDTAAAAFQSPPPTCRRLSGINLSSVTRSRVFFSHLTNFPSAPRRSPAPGPAVRRQLSRFAPSFVRDVDGFVEPFTPRSDISFICFSFVL